MTVNGRKGKKVILEKIRTSTLTSLDRLLLSFDSFRPSSFSRRIVHFDLWPFTLTYDRSLWLKRSSRLTQDRPLSHDRPLPPLSTVHFRLDLSSAIALNSILLTIIAIINFRMRFSQLTAPEATMTSSWRHYDVIITSLLRHYYVIITSLLRHYDVIWVNIILLFY